MTSPAAETLRPSDVGDQIAEAPFFDPAAFAAIGRALDGIERDPAELVEAMQWRAVGRMVEHCAAASPAWAERLAPVIEDGAFSPERWSEIPILRRQEVRENAKALRIDDLPADAGKVIDGETSGSTGISLKFTFTTRTSLVSRALTERVYEWHGLDLAAPAASIRNVGAAFADFPDGNEGRRWSLKQPGAPQYFLSVQTPPTLQFEWLVRKAPRYLFTYPTNARELAKAALRSGLPRPPLDAVLTVGEVVTDDIRELVAEAFGARIIDTYACDEVGKIAMQCEVSGLYHVCLASAKVELLAEDGSPAAPGEAGRVVVTGLHNWATPFIRYQIGDYAVPAAGTCPCGRSLPTLERILGRERNMLTLPNGDKRWLREKVIQRFYPHAPYRQYRVVQTARDVIEFHYVPEGEPRAADAEALSAVAREHIAPGMRVVPVPKAEIPRSAGGKYLDVVSLVS